MKNVKAQKFILLTVLLLVFCAALYACGSRSGAAGTPEALPEAPARDEPREQDAPEVTAAEELAAVLTAEELETVTAEYPNLKKLDLRGSVCYDAILAFRSAHPDIEVLYTVDVAGTAVEPEAERLTVTSAEQLGALAAAAPYLPGLSALELGELDVTPAQLDALREAFPGAEVTYTVELCGTRYPQDTETLDLSGVTPEEIDTVCGRLALLPDLRSIELTAEDGASCLGPEDAARLAAAAPDASVDYAFELFGQTVSLSQESLSFKSVPIGDEGVETLRQVLPLMTGLRYLKLDSCGIGNEACARLRDDFPAVEVVWRVFLAPNAYSALTDAEKIWVPENLVDMRPDGRGAENLKYCTKCRYLDVGHSHIERIDFVRYMPELEVAILAATDVSDLTPLAECPKLEYLELFTSPRISDLSPLAGLTELEYLNISNLRNVRDITPLYGLTSLKKLRATLNSIPYEQEAELRRLLPDCEASFDSGDPTGGSWRYDSSHSYVPRYAELREIFGYGRLEYSTDDFNG